MKLVVVELFNGKKWTIQTKAKRFLDMFLSDIKQSKMDALILVDGPEGVGKSFAARGIAMYAATFLGSTFDVDDIEFDTREYVDKALKAGPAEVSGKHKINVLDEARKALGRGKINNPGVENFLDFISECRDLGQVHILCVPTFHDLKRYIVAHRQVMTIHFIKRYVKDSSSPSGLRLHRGAYKIFIDKNDIRKYYDEGLYRYPKVWADYNNWSSKEVFNDEDVAGYLEKKRKYTLLKYASKPKKKQLDPKLVEVLIRRAVAKRMKDDGIPIAQIARWFGVTRSIVSKEIADKEATSRLVLAEDLTKELKIINQDKRMRSTVEDDTIDGELIG